METWFLFNFWKAKNKLRLWTLHRKSIALMRNWCVINKTMLLHSVESQDIDTLHIQGEEKIQKIWKYVRCKDFQLFWEYQLYILMTQMFSGFSFGDRMCRFGDVVLSTHWIYSSVQFQMEDPIVLEYRYSKHCVYDMTWYDLMYP